MKGVTITQVEVTCRPVACDGALCLPPATPARPTPTPGFAASTASLRHGIAERLSIFKAPQVALRIRQDV